MPRRPFRLLFHTSQRLAFRSPPIQPGLIRRRQGRRPIRRRLTNEWLLVGPFVLTCMMQGDFFWTENRCLVFMLQWFNVEKALCTLCRCSQIELVEEFFGRG